MLPSPLAFKSMLNRFFFFSTLFFMGLSTSHAAPLEGKVLERGTRTPLADIAVYALPHRLKTLTDAQGRFRFEDLPSGPITWVVNAAGFLKLEERDWIADASDSRALTSGAQPERELFLERQSYATYETTVTGRADQRDDSKRSLKASQVKTLPGAGGDPLKALQNLPGVNRPAPFSSQVIIQGSAPRDTRYLINGHEVPIIFHFGGLSSVVLPDALDRVDTLTAGYGAEYGRALGGLVSVWTRRPRTYRVHGLAFVDLINAGGFVEGPAGEQGRFLIGARQSYIGAILGAVAKDNDAFNFTLAPTFGDLVGIYERPLSQRDEFKVVTVGSSDTLQFLLKQPVDADPSIRGQFNTSTRFFRIIPELQHTHSARTRSRWSVGLGRDWIKFNTSENYFKIFTWAFTLRGEVERTISDHWTAQWGVDNAYTWARVDLLLREAFFDGGVGNPFGGGNLREVGADSKQIRTGAYWRNEFKLSPRWTLLPSLRVEAIRSSANGVREIFPLGRVAARYHWSDSLHLRAATGRYVQAPEPRELDSTFGNPSVRAPTSWHGAMGFEKDFRAGSSRGWRWSGGTFYRNFQDLVVPSSALISRNGQIVPENFTNGGSGRSYGFESLLQMDLSPWSGWLSYTLGRSTRQQPGQSEYPFQYDQTHLLTAIAAIELPKNWRLSSRFRYATGNPTTPIVGASFDADHDVYFPSRGAFYSQRLQPFFQIDLRADKKWIYRKWILSAYLDIQNVTNRKNLEAIQYSYNYQQSDVVGGLPILPTLGVQAEF
ncbi:MAG: hypothetical protein RJB38_726 [Pseudomonadota bacterium]